jgi:DNA-binding GntR family transcriptional regulator
MDGRSSVGTRGMVGQLEVLTYKQAAYQTMRDMIVELELQPGTRLVESELAAQLNVSKTPIREAIALLAADGLVDVAPYVGASVRWLSTLEMEESRFLLDAIEAPAVALVAERITRQEIKALDAIVRQLKMARAAGDGRLFRSLNVSYHHALFQPVGYARLIKFIDTLMGPVTLRYDRAFSDNFSEIWDAQLQLMLDRYAGIKRGDPQAAHEALRRGRAVLSELSLARVNHPLVAQYFPQD